MTRCYMDLPVELELMASGGEPQMVATERGTKTLLTLKVHSWTL